MMRRLLMSALVVSLSGLPALAEDAVPERTPWERSDPAPGKVVRWVVEGCAAYPVMVDDPSARPSAGTDLEARVDLPLETELSINHE